MEQVAGLEYSPELDGLADPGEVVWAWVPFEEDPGQGKDRPLLVIGRHRKLLLALQLTSKPHDEALDLGVGPWDRAGRPSYLRLDRVFALAEDDLRREGAVLPGELFARVAAVLMDAHGWRVRH
ncbi:hypothetical protein GCM10027589_53570 [Actinocorallia lasiicapitis]